MSKSFDKDLWDGYEVISKRIKEGTEFWEYYTKYLQKFASFSKDFGKSLQSLAKNKIYVEPESETLIHSWKTILESTDSIGKVFLDLSDELSRIPETMANHLKEAKKETKPLLSTGDKLYKLLHKNETSVQKAQIKSEKLIQQKDISIEEYNKARESQQANVVTKLGKKADADQKAAEKATKEFVKSMEALKIVQQKIFLNEMPKVLLGLQQLEEQRIQRMKSHFDSTLNAKKAIIPRCEDIFNRINTSIQTINPQLDIQTFIAANRSGNTLEFADPSKPFVPLTISSPAPSNTTLPQQSNSTSKFFKGKSSTKLNSPSTSNASSRHTSSYVPNKSPSAPKAIALFDYAATDSKELTFKKGDSITILQKDESGWWQGEIEGVIGMFPSNFVKEGDDQCTSSYAEEEGPGHSQIKAIYDYTAQDSSELSFVVGEIFSFDSEEEGWYYVYNSKNEYGRIPSNYVQNV